MGQLGDELRLHFLILADLYGHFVDGVGQFPDFIVIFGLNLGAVAAAGNPLGLLDDLIHRVQDGADIIAAAYERRAQHQHKHQGTDQCHQENLHIRKIGGGDVSEYTHHLTAAVDHRSGHGNDPLPGNRVLAHKARGIPGLDSLHNLRRGG